MKNSLFHHQTDNRPVRKKGQLFIFLPLGEGRSTVMEWVQRVERGRGCREYREGREEERGRGWRVKRRESENKTLMFVFK